MSQHSFNISNEDGASFRADVNAALQALASTSKGSGDPATRYAGQQTIDDDTPSSTVWTWNFYDGADKIKIGTFDTTANKFTPYHVYIAQSDLSGTPAAAAGTNTAAFGAGATVVSGTGGVAIGTAYVSATGAIAIQNGDNGGDYGAQASGAIAIGSLNLASGSYSVTLGGSENTASGLQSAVIGGTSNSVSSAVSAAIGGTGTTISSSGSGNVSIGSGNTQSGTGSNSVMLGSNHNLSSGSSNAVAAGTGHTITAAAATALGQAHTISGANSSAFGIGHTITGTSATAVGAQAKAAGYGQLAHAAGYFAAVGDAQTSVFVARRSTTNATQTEMFLDGGTASKRMSIPSDTTWAFTVTVVARRTDADNESAAYFIQGCIDNNAGTTALVGSVVKTSPAPIEDTSAWDVDVQADDTNDALVVKVTGESGKTIYWVARIETVEVTG